jgi:hypothetical protein
MLRRSIAGLVGMAMLGMALAASAADKDKAKDVKKEGKEVQGEITKIDKDKTTFTLKTEDGKKVEYKVDDSTKFIGPKGGESKEGVKDDRFVVGAPVTVVASKDGKTALEVHLPNRNDIPTKDKPTLKDKPSKPNKPNLKEKPNEDK